MVSRTLGEIAISWELGGGCAAISQSIEQAADKDCTGFGTSSARPVEVGPRWASLVAAAEHAYKTGWDYMTAGQQVGMSVRRLFIGEGGASPVPAPAPPGAKKELFEGVAVGFISDSLDFMNCSMDVRSDTGDFDKAMKSFEFGIRHFNLTDIKGAVQEFEMF